MSLIVETGTGSETADAYDSVANIDTYNTNHNANATWIAATTAAKEKAIRLSTQYLDSYYNRRWYGVRTTEDQALDWPRYSVVDTDGFQIDSDEIPTALKDACAEMAIKVAGGETPIADLSDPGTIKREKKKVGPILIETEWTAGNQPYKKYRIVEALLRQLVRPLGEIQRG